MEEKLKKSFEYGFMNHNHYSLVTVEEGKAVLRGELMDDVKNPYEMAHGGFTFGLGDTAMGLAAASLGRKAVTLNSNIAYLRPGVGSYLLAKAEVIKNGKTTCFIRANIYDEEERLVATMDGNYYYKD